MNDRDMKNARLKGYAIFQYKELDTNHWVLPKEFSTWENDCWARGVDCVYVSLHPGGKEAAEVSVSRIVGGLSNELYWSLEYAVARMVPDDYSELVGYSNFLESGDGDWVSFRALFTPYRARHVARGLVQYFRDLRKKQESNKDKNMVKLFKDGKALSVQTDASDEAQFTRDFAHALQDFMTSPQFEGQHEFEAYLKWFAEVCCKLRGYKSEVREQRLLTAGDVNPSSETLVTLTEYGTQTLKAVAA